MTITLERNQKDPQDMNRIFYGQTIIDKVTGNTASECMKQIAEMRRNNDMSKYTPYVITDVSDDNDSKLPKRDRLAFNLINAILAYASEIDYDDEYRLIGILNEMDITYDDFVHSGNGNYGVAREYYEVDDLPL